MNWRLIADGVLGFLVTAGTSALAAVVQGDVKHLSDVTDVAWFVVIVGAAVASAKTIQSRLAPGAKE